MVIRYTTTKCTVCSEQQTCPTCPICPEQKTCPICPEQKTCPVCPESNHWIDQGCWNDASARALTTFGGNLTSEECRKFAEANGLNVIGLQDGGQCFGGVNSEYKMYGPAQQCPNLGGPLVNHIFTKKYVPMEALNGWTDRGCWKDTSTRAIPTGANGVSTLEGCLTYANNNNMNVIGLQAGGQCFVGNNAQYQQYGKAEECSQLGQGWVNHVYTKS